MRNMRTILSLFSVAAIAALLAIPAFAQEGGQHEALGGEGAFLNFLQQHPDMKAELEADPNRINNPDFVKKHPELQTFYQHHPEVRTEMQENAADFMRHEKFQLGFRQNFNNFHDYLKGHPEVEDQLEKNPQLADDPNFMKQHPELHDYMKSHPEVAWQMKHDPHQFFSAENRSLEESNPGAKNAPAAAAPQSGTPSHKHHQHAPGSATGN